MDCGDKTRDKLLGELAVLRANEAKYRGLFETMAQGAVYQDAEGHILSANPAAQRILGLSLDQMQGRTSTDPRWKAIHEDGSDFPGNTHPSMVALKTGKEVHSAVMGVFNPKTDDHTWVSVDAVPQFKPGEETPFQVFTTFEDITERRETEQALRFQSEILARMSEGVNLVRASDLTIMFTNARFDALFGYASGELNGKHVSILNAHTGRSPAETATEIADSLNETGLWRGEVPNVKKDGTPFWMYACVSAYNHAEHGNVYISVVTDITERKRADDRLMASEKKSRAWLEHSPICTKIVDLDFNLQYMSAVGFRALKIEDSAQVYGKPFPFALYPEPSRNAIASSLEKVKATGEVIALEAAVNDTEGNELWFHSTLVPVNDDEGRIDYIIVVSSDTTERKKVEMALAKLMEERDQLLQHSPTTVYRCEPTGNYATTYVSPNIKRHTGYSPEDFTGDPDFWASHIHPEDRMRLCQDVSRLFEVGEHRHEYRFKHRDGTYHWMLDQLTLIRDAQGNPANIIGCWEDITELRQAEEREKDLHERLARAERMESLGVLAGGIAHDLNNLLGPNVGLVPMVLDDLEEVTKEQCENIDDVRECLAAINQSSIRAAETIKDIAVLSKSQVHTHTPLDINDAVTQYLKSREFAEIRRSSSNVSFNAELDKDNPWISGSRSHVGRLLSNLVRNAVLAIEEEGAVTIKTSCVCVENPVMGYEVIERGDYVVLEISDSGAGIEQEALERLFEPFFTTRKKANQAGSGLGLSVVRGIVANHGGAIDVKTEVGKGTTFALYFPALEESPEQAVTMEDAVPRGTERILVVDDEPHQLFFSKKALERQGYSIAAAANGHEAVGLFEQAKKAGGDSPFDLVVLDMLMEIGFDGLTTYKEILRLYPEQKAMIASGYAGDEKAEDEARQLGADWLAKPYQTDEIARAVRKRLDRNT
jgi:two-component system, cell cycle sensor histidine kinase and response regulator CckA